MAEMVVLKIEGELAYVALNRPDKRNAIDGAMLDAIGSIFQRLRDEAVRAVILYGEGAVFSAGIDFAALAQVGAGRRSRRRPQPALWNFREFVAAAQHSLNLIEQLETPVIAALQGYVGGLGLELALACDMRIAAPATRLGMPEVRVGLIPDVGGTTRLTRVVGYARAKELIMTARMVDAEQASRIGLVNEVCADPMEGARRLADELMANAPLAVGLAKRLIEQGAGLDKLKFMELEALTQSLLLQTEDFAEGATALAQRRTPSFKGR